jgi:hypothetical protein
LWNPGTEGSLPGGCLAESGWQDATHDDAVDICLIDTTAGHRTFYSGGTELRRRSSTQGALERAYRRSFCSDNNDNV